ncbi:hypothetical protein WI93_16415 [Burkholderia vietnamiensis]|nr:hypothetical protein WI93_16415 [Burkholderia vietnamiensis]
MPPPHIEADSRPAASSAPPPRHFVARGPIPAASPCLRECCERGVKRKAIENEPNGDPNDSAPERSRTANPLFVL